MERFFESGRSQRTICIRTFLLFFFLLFWGPQSAHCEDSAIPGAGAPPPKRGPERRASHRTIGIRVFFARVMGASDPAYPRDAVSPAGRGTLPGRIVRG